MNRMPKGTSIGAVVLAMASAVACAPPKTAAMTDAEARVVRDTVTVLENEINLAVDRLDCTAGYQLVGNREPMFVTNTTVVRARATFRKACDDLVANRTGAAYAVDTLTAQAISRDAAYVVREGLYTVSMKDGTSRRSYMVMTTVWDRTSGEWKMVHLHESYRPIGAGRALSPRASATACPLGVARRSPFYEFSRPSVCRADRSRMSQPPMDHEAARGLRRQGEG